MIRLIVSMSYVLNFILLTWASAAGGRGWLWPPMDFHTWYKYSTVDEA